MHKVFVYGTLLSGMGNNRLLKNSNLLGKAVTTNPHYLMINLGWFPGVIEDIDGIKINGEVYEVDDDTLTNLDHLEGYNSLNPTSGLYNRKTIDTNFGKAIIYIYNNRRAYHPSSVIKNGDWRSYYESLRNTVK